MGVAIDPKPPVGDRETAIVKTVKALWQASTKNYLGAAKSAYDAVTALRRADESNEQRAWTLWRESLAYALRDFFETANLPRKPLDEREFQRILRAILSRSAEIATASDEVGLSELHLSRPTEFPLYRALRDDLPDLIDHIAPDHGQGPDELRRKMDRSFSRRFPDAWTTGWSHFGVLESALGGKVGEAARRAEEWERYYDWLRWDVEDNPLFGQSEGGPALAAIFVRLRCYWRQRPPERRAEADEDARKVRAHVGWLREEVLDWLNAAEKDDILRVVTGGPGSGKSSSAKMIARKVAGAGRYNVFFTPLHGLDVSAPIENIVASYVQATKAGGRSLTESPLGWLPDDYKPLLLIFDGLDEVARPDGGATDVMRKFVANLRDWLGRANAVATEARVKAVVLGRPTAAETAAAEIALPDKALLHVARLSPLDEDSFRRDQDRGLEVSDPRGLCDTEQRLDFWNKWAAVAPDCPAEPPEALFERELSDLTVEPLLLYLLIFSGYVSDNWEDAAENRNRVYREIFRKVHLRDVKKMGHLLKAGLQTESDFFTLMECLGLAAWRGGGRTGTTARFEVLRDEIYAPEKADLFKEIESADLDNVALQFYTHRGHGDRPGYTFIHKSFGEYLTARALIEAGGKWLDSHAGRPALFAADWLKLTGQQAITPEILRFMAEQARLRVKPDASSSLDWQAARDKVARLARIAEWTLREGLPAHGDLGGGDADPSWRRREQAQRDAEEALYALIHVWGEAGYPMGLLGADVEQGGWSAGAVEIAWPERTAAGALLRRLAPHGVSAEASIARGLFSRMGLASATLSFANLFRADLRGADLRGADLRGADLRGADRGADLRGADLSGADLRGADLSGADLKSASCRRADFRASRLQDADFTDAEYLTQEQIDSAEGNSRTKLPETLTHPERWRENGAERPAASSS